MATRELNRVVKRGTFLYDGQVQCDIRIIESNVLYGYFEGEWIEPAVVEPEDGPRYYYLEFGSPTDKGRVASKSFAHRSIEEAIQAAEQSAGSTLFWGSSNRT